MKPSNFPGRKDQRRRGAMSRLARSEKPECKVAYDNTEKKLVADAHMIRTKKKRGV